MFFPVYIFVENMVVNLESLVASVAFDSSLIRIKIFSLFDTLPVIGLTFLCVFSHSVV